MNSKLIVYNVDGALLIRLGKAAHRRVYELLITPDYSHTIYAESDRQAKSYARSVLGWWRPENETA